MSTKAGHRYLTYDCLTHVQRGGRVCANDARLPMGEIDTLVLDMFKKDLLDTKVIRAAIAEAVRRLRADTNAQAERARLTATLAEIRAEQGRLADAIATGGHSPILLTRLREREGAEARVLGDLDRLSTLEQASALDSARIGRDLKGALVDWQGLLMANVQQARQVLRKLMVGRLIVTPNPDTSGVTISGTGLLEPLLDQVLALPKAGVTPAGFEPASGHAGLHTGVEPRALETLRRRYGAVGSTPLPQRDRPWVRPQAGPRSPCLSFEHTQRPIHGVLAEPPGIASPYELTV